MKKKSKVSESSQYNLICAKRVHQTENNLKFTLLDELHDMQKLQTFAIDSVRLERMFTDGMVYTKQDCKELTSEQKRSIEKILKENEHDEI